MPTSEVIFPTLDRPFNVFSPPDSSPLTRNKRVLETSPLTGSDQIGKKTTKLTLALDVSYFSFACTGIAGQRTSNSPSLQAVSQIHTKRSSREYYTYYVGLLTTTTTILGLLLLYYYYYCTTTVLLLLPLLLLYYYYYYYYYYHYIYYYL